MNAFENIFLYFFVLTYDEKGFIHINGQ